MHLQARRVELAQFLRPSQLPESELTSDSCATAVQLEAVRYLGSRNWDLTLRALLLWRGAALLGSKERKAAAVRQAAVVWILGDRKLTLVRSALEAWKRLAAIGPDLGHDSKERSSNSRSSQTFSLEEIQFEDPREGNAAVGVADIDVLLPPHILAAPDDTSFAQDAVEPAAAISEQQLKARALRIRDLEEQMSTSNETAEDLGRQLVELRAKLDEEAASHARHVREMEAAMEERIEAAMVQSKASEADNQRLKKELMASQRESTVRIAELARNLEQHRLEGSNAVARVDELELELSQRAKEEQALLKQTGQTVFVAQRDLQASEARIVFLEECLAEQSRSMARKEEEARAAIAEASRATLAGATGCSSDLELSDDSELRALTDAWSASSPSRSPFLSGEQRTFAEDGVGGSGSLGRPRLQERSCAEKQITQLRAEVESARDRAERALSTLCLVSAANIGRDGESREAEDSDEEERGVDASLLADCQSALLRVVSRLARRAETLAATTRNQALEYDLIITGLRRDAAAHHHTVADLDEQLLVCRQKLAQAKATTASLSKILLRRAVDCDNAAVAWKVLLAWRELNTNTRAAQRQRHGAVASAAWALSSRCPPSVTSTAVLRMWLAKVVRTRHAWERLAVLKVQSCRHCEWNSMFHELLGQARVRAEIAQETTAQAGAAQLLAESRESLMRANEWLTSWRLSALAFTALYSWRRASFASPGHTRRGATCGAVMRAWQAQGQRPRDAWAWLVAGAWQRSRHRLLLFEVVQERTARVASALRCTAAAAAIGLSGWRSSALTCIALRSWKAACQGQSVGDVGLLTRKAFFLWRALSIGSARIGQFVAQAAASWASARRASRNAVCSAVFTVFCSWHAHTGRSGRLRDAWRALANALAQQSDPERAAGLWSAHLRRLLFWKALAHAQETQRADCSARALLRQAFVAWSTQVGCTRGTWRLWVLRMWHRRQRGGLLRDLGRESTRSRAAFLCFVQSRQSVAAAQLCGQVFSIWAGYAARATSASQQALLDLDVEQTKALLQKVLLKWLICSTCSGCTSRWSRAAGIAWAWANRSATNAVVSAVFSAWFNVIGKWRTAWCFLVLQASIRTSRRWSLKWADEEHMARMELSCLLKRMAFSAWKRVTRSHDVIAHSATSDRIEAWRCTSLALILLQAWKSQLRRAKNRRGNECFFSGLVEPACLLIRVAISLWRHITRSHAVIAHSATSDRMEAWRCTSLALILLQAWQSQLRRAKNRRGSEYALEQTARLESRGLFLAWRIQALAQRRSLREIPCRLERTFDGIVARAFLLWRFVSCIAGPSSPEASGASRKQGPSPLAVSVAAIAVLDLPHRLGCAQAALIRTMVRGWRNLLLEASRDAEQQRILREALARGRASLHAIVEGPLNACQTLVLVRVAFGTWAASLRMAQEERAVQEAVMAQAVHARRASDSMVRSAARLLASQSRALIRTVLVAWSALVSRGRLVELQEKLATEASAHMVQRLAELWAATEQRSSARLVFLAWKTCLEVTPTAASTSPRDCSGATAPETASSAVPGPGPHVADDSPGVSGNGPSPELPASWTWRETSWWEDRRRSPAQGGAGGWGDETWLLAKSPLTGAQQLVGRKEGLGQAVVQVRDCPPALRMIADSGG